MIVYEGVPDKVVVTGLGLITALGGDAEATWKSLLTGSSALSPGGRCEVARLHNHHVGEVRNFHLPESLRERRVGRLDLCHQLLLTAVDQALVDARLSNADLKLAGIDPRRVGVILGSSLGGTLSAQVYERRRLLEGRAVGQYLRDYMLHTCLDVITSVFDFRGQRTVFSTACTASTIAIAYAYELLRRRRLDVVVTGGVDVLTDLSLAGFTSMNVISPQACAPFSLPAGLNIGEGAGILILERESVAAGRGARPRARLLGYGLTCDAYHATSPDPSGKAQVAAGRVALAMAGITASDIDYVSAHGTGTAGNDPVESRSLRILLGEQANRVPVSSSKGAIGHTLGAAGGTEAVITVLSVDAGKVPPTANYTGSRSDCDLDYVPGSARNKPIRYALKENFAFGGNNAALVVAHPAVTPAPEAAAAPVRLAVTGIGVVNPLAVSADQLVRLFDGDSTAIAPARRFETAGLPVTLAADFDSFRPEELTRASVRRLDRYSCFTLIAAEMALRDSGLRLTSSNQERVGVIAGTTHGPIASCETFFKPIVLADGQRPNPALFANTVLNAGVGQAAIHLRLKGCNIALSCGYAAGLSAIVTACDLISAGAADLILAGGVDELDRCILEGYAAARAIAPLVRGGQRLEGCMPFGPRRSGPVLGEGGAMVALEPLDRALARGARVYAEIVGWSGNADIAIDRGRDPTGDGLAACMKEALAYGQLGPEKIDLVAAAGLSHPQLDAIEARAIEQVFGRLPVSVAALSTRFGTCAATPVVSLAAVGLGMFHGFTPWARSGFAPGEEAEGRLALQTAPLKQSPRGAIVNAISPGGTNYSLVLERPCP